MPGLTGDIASARWVAKIAIIRSAAVTPDAGDQRSELTEFFVMEVTLLNSDATNSAAHRRFSTRQLRSLDVSLDGVLDLKFRTRNLNAP
jgi:hypothetical protein